MQSRYFASLRVAVALLAASGALHAGARAADPFADCAEGFAAAPEDRGSAACFFDTAKRQVQWDRAARELEARRDRHRDNPWLPLYLGHVHLYRGSAEAEDAYRDAARIAEGRGDVRAEVEARIAWTRYLSRKQRYRAAEEVLAPAVRIAKEAGDPILLAQVGIRQAWQARYQGKNLDTAYHLLLQVEQDVFRDGPESLQQQWLDATAVISHLLGRSDEYLRYKERLLGRAIAAGHRADEAAARYDIANHHITSELPSPQSRAKARRLLEAALAAAEAAEHPSIAALSHLGLGQLLEGDEGRGHLRACLGIATDRDDPELLKLCRGALAASLIADDPRRARELMEQALNAGAESPDPWFYGWEDRLPVHWATLPREAAVRRSLDILDGIEALRESQTSGAARAGLMSMWMGPYSGLAGRLLRDGGGREDLELAFAVTERMRARVLLEALEAAQAASPPPADDPAVRELSATLERKVEIQRRLLSPALAAEARAGLVAELDTVESEAARLRHRIAQAYPAYADLRRPTLASLHQVEASLGAGEALLSYQIGVDKDFYGRFAGGAWLLVATRGGSRSYRLADDRVDLEPALDSLLGLADLGTAVPGLARLHETLLRDALADLPPTVDRLVILPDGKLHRLPFSLLRPGAEADPLIARFELSVAPSATLWRRFKDLEAPTSETPALALADPTLAYRDHRPRHAEARKAGGGGEPVLRQWALADGVDLPPLPYAREEGRAVVAALGGESLLLEGEAATERFLKEHDLRRFGVLHFATHAVIDDQVPERSAVMLAPGAQGEDGWLQPREIVELELDGRVVVLASCNSATGRVLRGEGVMSLARAFFHAGAPVVVASLWPLPDDQTAAVFRLFYRHLASGESVAGALAQAQRERHRQGAPARTWAGLVVLGNGDLVPFPDGLEGPSPPWLAGVLLLAVLAAAGLALFFRRRRAP